MQKERGVNRLPNDIEYFSDGIEVSRNGWKPIAQEKQEKGESEAKRKPSLTIEVEDDECAELHKPLKGSKSGSHHRRAESIGEMNPFLVPAKSENDQEGDSALSQQPE